MNLIKLQEEYRDRKGELIKKLAEIVVSSVPFSSAPELDKKRLISKGIIRGPRLNRSVEDIGEIGAREEAERALRAVAFLKGCSHVYGCSLIPVGGYDTTYGKVWETFYVIQGEGYGRPNKRNGK